MNSVENHNGKLHIPCEALGSNALLTTLKCRLPFKMLSYQGSKRNIFFHTSLFCTIWLTGKIERPNKPILWSKIRISIIWREKNAKLVSNRLSAFCKDLFWKIWLFGKLTNLFADMRVQLNNWLFIFDSRVNRVSFDWAYSAFVGIVFLVYPFVRKIWRFKHEGL